MRRAVTVLVALGLVTTLGYWLGTRWDRSSPPDRAAGCLAEADGQVRLEVEQMANAATITAVGVRMEMPDRAVKIALATALQESKLHNLPHLGRRNDHDSVGLFQQRPSQGWGTKEQVGEPRYAAERFYRALRRIDGWQELRLTEAAQRVQRSAFPDAYQKWEPQAGVLATALLGAEPGAVSCIVPADPPERGPAAADALGEALAQEWGTSVRTGPEAEPVGALRLAVMPTASLPSATLASRSDVSALDRSDAVGSAPGVAVTAGDPRTGWRYAHWLVSHAAARGVTRVHYADLEWTAAAGGWSAAGETSEQVWAEVATG